MPLVQSQRFHVNDEQYLAFSRDVINDGKVLPYLEMWDQQSWFVCCLIQEALIQHHYFDTARQFNNCEIRNDQHSGTYPHNLDFAHQAYQQYMREHFPAQRKRPAEYRTLLQIDGSPIELWKRMLQTISAVTRRTGCYRRLRGI
jgi:hypothetical protein